MTSYLANLSQRVGEKLTEKLISLPSETALLLSNLPEIERKYLYPRYEKFLAESQDYLPKLNPDEQKIVDTLEQHGICVTSLAALCITNSDLMMEAGQHMTCEFKQSKLPHASQTRQILTGQTADVLKYPEIFRWGLDHKLLRIVENYLKLPAAYDGYSYYFSVSDGAETGPRKWHRDKEDRRMVKIGVYLNDVDEEGGPFECLYPEINQWICDRITPQYKVLRHVEVIRLLEECPYLGSKWHHTCLGTKGTVFFVDTARYYHRGKPPTQTNRAALFFHYFSRRPKHPFFCERAPLSQEARLELAEGLSAYQRRAITWKQELPNWIQRIPKNWEKV